MKRYLMLLLLLFSTAALAQAQDNPPPGQLVEVNGTNMHIHCAGEGQPTVLIDAGMGEWSLHWQHIQAALAEHTHACVYDRSGYGWSDISDTPRTGENIVNELNMLLENAGIEGPYIALGHSLGGVHMRMLAAHNPDVIGLVLVDSPMPGHELLPEMQAFMAESYEPFPSYATYAEQGFITPDQIPLPEYIPQEIASLYQAQTATAGFFSTIYAEYQALDDTMRQLAETDVPSDLTAVVIAAPLPDSVPGIDEALLADYQANVWLPGQEALADSFAEGQFIVAENSRHHIQFDAPQIIIDATVEMVGSLRAAS